MDITFHLINCASGERRAVSSCYTINLLLAAHRSLKKLLDPNLTSKFRVSFVMSGIVMKEKCERLLQAREFAKRAGVTVRTLHHYDRLGLLRPMSYTEAGYRLYSEKSFVRLQQIVTLKFIGFSLKEIKEILNRDSYDLADSLRVQKEILKAKRQQLDSAVKAIEKAERVLSSGEETGWEAFAKIVEVINMQENMDWVKKYYTKEQLEELASRWNPEVQKKAEEDWNNLFKDITEAKAQGEDPASGKSQSFVKRWDDLIEQFTGSNEGIRQSLTNLYSDQANWEGNFQKPWSDDVGDFISKARAAQKS